MRNIIIEDKEFSSKSISPLQSLFICRKIAPMFIKMATEECPAIDALASLSQEDMEYIIGKVLPLISIKLDTGWDTIWNTESNCIKYEFIHSGIILELVIQIAIEELPNYFTGLGRIEERV